MLKTRTFCPFSGTNGSDGACSAWSCDSQSARSLERGREVPSYRVAQRGMRANDEKKYSKYTIWQSLEAQKHRRFRLTHPAMIVHGSWF